MSTCRRRSLFNKICILHRLFYRVVVNLYLMGVAGTLTINLRLHVVRVVIFGVLLWRQRWLPRDRDSPVIRQIAAFRSIDEESIERACIPWNMHYVITLRLQWHSTALDNQVALLHRWLFVEGLHVEERSATLRGVFVGVVISLIVRALTLLELHASLLLWRSAV